MSDLILYRQPTARCEDSDEGFGFQDQANGSVACAQKPNDVTTGAFEEFVPLTTGNHWLEADFGTVTDGVPQSLNDYSDSCDCNGDPGAPAIPRTTVWGSTGTSRLWVPATPRCSRCGTGSPPGTGSRAISATGGNSLIGTAGSALSATVASVSDPNSSDTPSNLAATINWGDGGSSAGTITGANGSFTVAGTHTYASGGSYPVTVTISRAGSSAVATDTAVITSAPTAGAAGAATVGITGAGFSGAVNPGGLPTTATFQYGLDPKYTGGGPVVYTQSTPSQAVGSDFTSHPVSAPVTGLVPNALYHVRLAATNSAGTTFGPDATFTTKATAPPSKPTLGQTFNVAPVSGVILVKINGQFVPLTQLRQIPQNVVIDALHGTLQVTTAAPGGSGGAHDAAAKGKQHKGKKVKTQTGRFGGAVFKLKQAHNGLATLTLVEGAVKGGPSFAKCKAKAKAGDVTATAAASKTLQLMHASAKGKFSTKGKYAAATVRGTKWTIADRCDGTLTHDVTDSVAVTDFVRHKTVVLHAGQSYLAKATKRK